MQFLHEKDDIYYYNTGYDIYYNNQGYDTIRASCFS